MAWNIQKYKKLQKKEEREREREKERKKGWKWINGWKRGVGGGNIWWNLFLLDNSSDFRIPPLTGILDPLHRNPPGSAPALRIHDEWTCNNDLLFTQIPCSTPTHSCLALLAKEKPCVIFDSFAMIALASCLPFCQIRSWKTSLLQIKHPFFRSANTSIGWLVKALEKHTQDGDSPEKSCQFVQRLFYGIFWHFFPSAWVCVYIYLFHLLHIEMLSHAFGSFCTFLLSTQLKNWIHRDWILKLDFSNALENTSFPPIAKSLSLSFFLSLSPLFLFLSLSLSLSLARSTHTHTHFGFFFYEGKGFGMSNSPIFVRFSFLQNQPRKWFFFLIIPYLFLWIQGKQELLTAINSHPKHNTFFTA